MSGLLLVVQLLGLLFGQPKTDAGGTWDPWGNPSPQAGGTWDPDG